MMYKSRANINVVEPYSIGYQVTSYYEISILYPISEWAYDVI